MTWSGFEVGPLSVPDTALCRRRARLASWRPGVLAQCGLCPRRHFTGSQGGGGTDQSPRGSCWRTSSLRWGTPGAALPPPARASRTATSSLQSGPGQQCLLARGVALCRTARSAVQRPRAVATCTTRWGPGSAVRRLGLGHCARWPESISRCPGHPAGAWSSTQLSHRMSKHRFPRAAGQRKPGR